MKSRCRKLTHDGLLTIAVGKSRRETHWKNQELLWSELVGRFSETLRTPETFEEYLKMDRARQDEIKDVGGLVGGSLRNGRRRVENVEWRQLITLDADHGKGDLWAGVEVMLGCGAALYSTHSHSPQSPRLRLVFPLKRPVTPDEYQAVSRRIAADLGMDFFDDTTYQPHRLMYWPSTARDGEFVFQYLDAEWLDPDEVLARYPDWRDSSSWPQSSRSRGRYQKQAQKQGNPREKPGIVGAFCRTYSVEEAIDTFLSSIYTACDVPHRYTYVPGTASAGLVIYGEGDFAYSHHGTDPVSGRLCNAFDLVRLHKFGELDQKAREDTPVTKLPSYQAMQELAVKDAAVRKQVAGERMAAAAEDFTRENWQESLEITGKGKIKNTLSNMILILRHDPALSGIFYNEFRGGIDVGGGVEDQVPWKRLKPGWNRTDEAGLAGYVDSIYDIYSTVRLKEAALKVSVERSRHPIRDYLENLPTWDGVKRLDTLLIQYLGAEDSGYVRAVTRKTLCAAVARVYEPGSKFDTMLVLNGPQGIGKSTLFAKLAGCWFSDSLSISDMRDKTAAEKLQGYWIIEIGELAGFKKVEEETVKSFLSRQDDKYRASYGFSVEDHPRQCIIVGSTNKETGFLRDLTGNRRFWPIGVSGRPECKPWDIKDLDQIWAEALFCYRMGEKLYLEGHLEGEAQRQQVEALEIDDREGLVRDYLDKLLPLHWDRLQLSERRSYVRGDSFTENLKGEVRREKVCTLEIWCELFGKEAASLRKIDAFEINAILRKIEGWESGERLRLPLYGRQRVYTRTEHPPGQE